MQAALDETVGTLKRRAQIALGVGSGRLLDSSGCVMEGTLPIKKSRVQNGDSLTLLRNTVQVQATAGAFAAVVTWGNAGFGGDCSAVQAQLKNVQQIQATLSAFAAILDDGSVATWGDVSRVATAALCRRSSRMCSRFKALVTALSLPLLTMDLS